jgi:iron complex outermembrane receptor protein
LRTIWRDCNSGARRWRATPARAGAGIHALGLIGLLALNSAGAQEQKASPLELPDLVVVVGVTPAGSTGIPRTLYPGNVQSIPGTGIRPETASVAEIVDRASGSVSVNDTQGNPFQADLNYRGYTASPVLGTPQGLSVYVDGMRVNEPFGDVVSWDLIPRIAIANVTVIPGTNPVYGLNTLGGAISINTKSGFAFPGASIDLGAGSFGRRSFDAQYGGHGERTDYYLAASLYDENGWAVSNPSRVRQLFAKTGFQDWDTDVDLSIQYADNSLAGNQLVPHSMLGEAARGYTHPDLTSTQNFVLNLSGRRDFSETGGVEGNVYYRRISRDILNSNINDPVVPGAPAQAASCAALFGEACSQNILTQETQNAYGLNAQLTNQGKFLGYRQYFSAGVNAESGTTRLSQFSQDANLDADRAVVGVAPFSPQSAIGSRARRYAVYATDTLVLGERASVTLSGRFDRASLALSGTSVDQAGNAVSLDGDHAYQRFNPALGGTYKAAPGATLFANYAEGFRAPSAIELACADPAHPCAGVPNAFSADPELRAVVARSVEIGARGRLGADAEWRVAAFRSTLHDDILFNQSTVSTGYFSNVGKTRREGVESSLSGKQSRWDYALSATWLSATYRSAFEVANPANPGSACPGPGCVPVQPGDRIPGIPRLIGKLLVGYRISLQTRVEAQLVAQDSQYARGDENNMAAYGRIPGYALVRLGVTRQLAKNAELVGGVTNLFDRRFAGFGALAANNVAGGNAENFWAVGQPRAYFAGLRAAF